jgi:uncharacterized membrane-anchored protein
MKLQDYKGYEIFVDIDGNFEAKRSGKTELAADRLADLKEKIDRLEEKRIRQPVLIQAYMNKIVKGGADISSKVGYRPDIVGSLGDMERGWLHPQGEDQLQSALQDKLEHLSAKDIGYGDQR